MPTTNPTDTVQVAIPREFVGVITQLIEAEGLRATARATDEQAKQRSLDKAFVAEHGPDARAGRWNEQNAERWLVLARELSAIAAAIQAAAKGEGT